MHSNIKVINLGFDSAVWYNEDGSIRLPLPNQLQAETKYKHSAREKYDRIAKLKQDTGVTLPGRGTQFLPNEGWFKNDIKDIFFSHIKSDYDFKIHSIEYLSLNAEIPFLYPILIYTQHIFNDIDKVFLSPNLIECIKRNQAKIHMHVVWEGFLFDDPFYTFHDYHMESADFLNSIHRLMDRYNLPDNSLLISSANLRSNEIVETLLKGRKKRFKIFELDWFRVSKWCTSRSDEGIEEKFNECLNSKKFTKHFLSMNRVSRHHRTIIHSEVTTNPKLKDKVAISFSKITPELHMDHLSLLKDNYRHGKERLFQADYSTDKILDVGFKNFSNTYYTAPVNLATVFGWDFHNSTFLNIISETLVTPSTVFMTEKIHKPIISAQPFIVVGNPFYLKKMNELGYITFSSFWDESYDLEIDFTRRFEKIVDVLEHISTWSLVKCKKVYDEMVPILKHNFNIYMDNKQYFDHLEFMYSESVGTGKKLM